MRKVNNILFKTVLCILAAFASVSCMEKEGPSADRQSVMIELRVFAEGMTKATEAPTDMEKVINSLRVYAFYGDRAAGYVQRQATSLGEPFYMDLELPETGIHNVDFYLIANEEEMAYENGLVQLSENMTRAQLEAIKYTGIAKRTSLPMYCRHLAEPVNVDAVTNAPNTEAGHEGHFILADPVEFTLERSLAKLSVYAAKVEGSTAVPQITQIELLSHGTREYSYLFPQTAAVLDGVPARANNRIVTDEVVEVTSSVAKGSSAAADPANYTEIATGFYLPEVREGLPYDDPAYRWDIFTGSPMDAARSAVLHIEYSMGAGQELKHGYVYLPCVKRNAHIKVCILINSEGNIIINYVVADWVDNAMPDYRFDYPTHTYLLESIPAAGESSPSHASKEAQMSETVPFRGYFQMTYPENDNWTPTLIGLNASQCTVRVFDYTGNTEVPRSAWPIQASDDWFMIEVSPNPGHMQAGETVTLAISYTATGFEIIEYMMINGTDQNFYWPYQDPAAQDADYVIITMVN